MVKISPEWVTGPEQGKSSGKIATFSLWMGIYSGVDRHTRGQSGVMIWIHKSISNKINHYKFCNNKGIETRLKTQRGHLTILGVYALTEGRDELNEHYRRYWIK